MARQSVVQRRVVLIAFVLLIFLLLLAAAINVPWAVTFCHSRTTIR